MESATNLDTCRFKMFSENHHFVNRLQHIQNHQIAAPSVAFTLQVELLEAQNRLRVLEAQKELSKRKLKLYLRKTSEERSSWLKKERKKFDFVFDELKDDLRRERRTCKQIETVCSKLQNELIDVDTLGKEFALKYDKEKKERLLAEALCRKLEKENEGIKAKVKVLKCEKSMIQVHMEEQRKMSRMAELMREEQVHMKLMDAKLLLEEKYTRIHDLIVDLEIILRSKDMDSNVLYEEYENILSNLERDSDNASCKETVTFAGNVASTLNFAGSEDSVHAICTGRNVSSGKGVHATSADNESLKSQWGEISSGPVSCHGEQECSCLCSKNPHLARAMKGCTEWPRAIQRSGLKSKLLEARFASQRIQLRGILKQKNVFRI
ncbi:hypothetical protein LIER_35288 [Lithospermum erythrorhizon]|uniref:Uncharacterized protein n=1 Tax=Lithospermum erythrorhizon TaxID=34254 RepID=A0AAV3NNA6_LITER